MKKPTKLKVLTVVQIAELFNVKPATVRKWAIKGKLPAKKLDKSWFFSESEINKYFNKKEAP